MSDIYRELGCIEVDGTPVKFNAANVLTNVGGVFVVDNTLSIPGAAADAKKTGDEIGALKEDLSNKLSVNLNDATLLTSNTDLFTLSVGEYYSNSSQLTETIINKPTGVTTGFHLIVYTVSATTRRGMILATVNRGVYYTSEGSNGYYSWLKVASKNDIDAIVSAITADSAQIYNSDGARFEIEDGERDKTVNLIDSTTLTDGYILVADVPTERANYFYSDYIKVGRTPICYRDQGASISYLVSCYDADKNYIGAVDYNSAEGYERITDATLSHYKISPKKGTVYIRVNGRYKTNLMLCPYFYPTRYVSYGETYHADGLKVAMFGDSITYGTNGDTSQRTDKNLVYWLKKLTPYMIDNYGEGSMGWVSTSYNPRIAYDRLLEVDLTEYDVITLCFGVNDSAATMGEYDSIDENTIMGQVNKCIKYIGSQNPNARIIIIAPWNGRKYGSFPDWRYANRTSGGFTRAELSETLRQAAEYYYIGFISQKDSPINGFGLGTVNNEKTGPYLGSDNVHPSEAGYEAMGHWLAGKLTSIIK